MSQDNRPTHKLTLVHKSDNKNRNRDVGAVWHDTERDSINIKLNPGIVLTAELCEEYWLTAWPAEGNPNYKPPPERGERRDYKPPPSGNAWGGGSPPGQGSSIDDDIIPF